MWCYIFSFFYTLASSEIVLKRKGDDTRTKPHATVSLLLYCDEMIAHHPSSKGFHAGTFPSYITHGCVWTLRKSTRYVRSGVTVIMHCSGFNPLYLTSAEIVLAFFMDGCSTNDAMWSFIYVKNMSSQANIRVGKYSKKSLMRAKISISWVRLSREIRKFVNER